jgi:hypothetical protein
MQKRSPDPGIESRPGGNRMTKARLVYLAAAVVWTVGLRSAVAAETYTATAEVKDAAGAKKTAPVTITLDRLSTDAENQAVMGALRSQGVAAAKKALQGLPDVGWVDAAGKRTPIKYAFARPSGGGRLLTILCAQPIVHIGEGLPDAKPREGYDIASAFLILDASGKGHGECAPAGKVKLGADGSVAIEDYGGMTVWLTDVAKK